MAPVCLPPSPSYSAVGDSKERGEECGQHVRSQKVPPGPGEQRSVFASALLLLSSRRAAEPGPQRPVGVPHLPRWPGHPGLSWSGAQQSG